MELVRTSQATTLLCTPSYALHLAEVAAENGVDTASLEVRKIIVAGESGGSVPAIRDRIEGAWNARVIDHAEIDESPKRLFQMGQQTVQRAGILQILKRFLPDHEEEPCAGA